ncbi:MAG TPA: signal peptidase II [Gemmatimonadaceae bacterium]|nr:signal peptidase II [Gemmatimonadaceae bacterium]
MERRAPDDGTTFTAPPRAVMPNATVFWPIALLVVALDLVTKAIAAYALVPEHIPHRVIGDVVRLTLVYNPGAAFGIHVGEYSRPVFSILTLAALGILWRLFRGTRGGDYRRVLALALVSAGAVGNLLDRLRSSRGVVDFIDLGAGDWRWPTFNVADIAVTSGALLLALVLWREDREASRAAVPAEHPTEPADAAESTRPAALVERGGAL